MDFRSPGAVNLREVFDVSYAVHRQEEEGKRRKNFKQGYRGANGLNALNEEDDYESDDTVTAPADADADALNPPAKVPRADGAGGPDGALEQKMRNTSLGQPSAAAQARQASAPRSQPVAQQPTGAPQAKGYGQHSPAVAAAARQQVKKNKGPFELSLDNATLLGRRGKQGDNPQGSKLRQQIVQ